MGLLQRMFGRKSGIAAATAARPVPRGTYLVVPGDSFWKIAQRVYRDSNRWYEVFTANRRLIRSPDLLHPGMTIRLP